MLFWEYPRETPEGEQTDLVEVMEIEEGRIRRNTIYYDGASFARQIGLLPAKGLSPTAPCSCAPTLPPAASASSGPSAIIADSRAWAW